jgi:hypothetical protein
VILQLLVTTAIIKEGRDCVHDGFFAVGYSVWPFVPFEGGMVVWRSR